MKVAASSMVNTIYICLFSAIICGVFLMIFSYQYFLFEKYKESVNLISENKSAAHFYLQVRNENKKDKEDLISSQASNIESYYSRGTWGIFESVAIISKSEKDSVFKNYFVSTGPVRSNSQIIHLSDNDRPLTLGSDVFLIGNMKIPKGKFLKKGIGESSFKGNVAASEKKLPPLNFEGGSDYKFQKHEIIDFSKITAEGGIVNSFNNPVKFIDTKDQVLVDGLTISGNIILSNEEEIILGKDLKVKDIIIQAPRVTIQKGFNGTCQIFATDLIKVEEEVTLNYPSIVYLEAQEDSSRIVIDKNSKIVGGIILNNNQFQPEISNSIDFHENSEVVGNIFSTSYLDLKGKINGIVYAEALYSKNSVTGSIEMNTLERVSIKNDLPYHFFKILSTNVEETENFFIKEVW